MSLFKTKATERIESVQDNALDKMEAMDPASEDFGRAANNVKVLSEAKANESKTKQQIIKDIFIGLGAAALGIISMAIGEKIKGDNEVKMLDKKIDARREELAECIAQENGTYGGEVEKIPVSPTLKRVLNQGIKL